jgi:NaMN:DMB phosphoribosyltransferase
MGASYVTGTAPGAGAAFPGQRGPGNNRDVFQAVQAVGGVVAAGVLGSSTSATVNLVGLTQPSSAYAVFAQAQGANVEIAISKDTAATFSMFTVTPASAAVVGWMVVRA